MRRIFRGAATIAAALVPAAAYAQNIGSPAALAVPGALDRAFAQINGGPGGGMTLSLQLLLIMGLLTILPSLILMMTSFTRILIVLSILRQALGLQQSPPNQVLIGLSLFLSLFIMAPTLEAVNRTAIAPYAAGTLNATQAIGAAGDQFHGFMIRQTRNHDLAMFTDIALARNDNALARNDNALARNDNALARNDNALARNDNALARNDNAHAPHYERSADVPFTILLPAFVTSELKTAFQIGFMLYLPFLVIDLVVSSVLMSLGMMMMSPTIVSLPFKLLLFVLVDGWALLMGSLAASFG